MTKGRKCVACDSQCPVLCRECAAAEFAALRADNERLRAATTLWERAAYDLWARMGPRDAMPTSMRKARAALAPDDGSE